MMDGPRKPTDLGDVIKLMQAMKDDSSGSTSDRNNSIPTGLAHLELLEEGAKFSQGMARRAFWEKRDDANLRLIGTCLCILYQAATCHRKWHGSGHVLESMCGKAYNAAAAAMQLGRLGYYDEALSLVRGIGEIANLVALSTVEKGAIQEWLRADEKTRWNKFRPGKVRERLAKADVKLPLIADADWYSSLTEKYTHLSPKMRPNFHNEERPVCGGVFQPKGLNEVLGSLVAILMFLSMFICRYFQFDDLFEEITRMIREDAKMASEET
jgi:hypothetical protein